MVANPDRNAAGEVTGAHSMASDPAFEQRARDFEVNLGADAAVKANRGGVIGAAAAKVRDYIEEKAGTWDARSRSLRELLEKSGTRATEDKMKEWSGTVGKAAGTLKTVIDQGMLGERCMLIETFWNDIVLPDFLAPPTFETRTAAAEAGFDQAMLTGRVTGTGGTWNFYQKPDPAAAPAGSQQQTVYDTGN